MKICLFPICAFLCAASALAQMQLNNTPVAGGGVKYGGGGQDAAPMADSSRVVYMGDLTTNNVDELYSASITAAGTQITLNNTPVSGGDIYNFAPTANGSRAVYRGDLTTDNVVEIYSASTTAAGTQITLNNTPAVGSISNWFSITADSSKVVYSGALTTVNVTELYSASTTAAGTQVKLNNTPVTNGDVYSDSIFLTPDSSKALYLGDLTTDTVVELYSASTTASGTQIKVNNSPVPGGSVTGGSGMNATPTADSSRVVYAGDLTTVGVKELYSASTTAAGTQIKLTDTLVPGGDVRSFALTANGSRAVYTGNLETATAEIYSASTTATGTQIKLNNTVAGGNISSFATTADSSRVVYQGDLTMDGVEELYSASTTATGTQIKLNDTPVSGGYLGEFALTADSSRVVYTGDLTTPGFYGLYSASTTSAGTQVMLVTGAATVGVMDFKLAPNSEFVIYRQIDMSTFSYSLWQVDLLGSSAPTQLTPSTAYPLTINSYSILPDSSGVVFNADLTTQGVNNLYSAATVPEPSTWALTSLGLAVSLWRLRRRKFNMKICLFPICAFLCATSALAQTQLNDTPVAGGHVSIGVAITADNSKVVYIGDLTVDNAYNLYSASPTTAGTQITLSTPVAANGGVNSFKPTADSSRVVYRAYPSYPNPFELYSASTTAAGTEVKLNNTPVAGGAVGESFAPSPNSSRVVYMGDLTTNDVVELYSASTTQSGTQIKLNNTPVADGDVSSFAITADSSRVVYLGDITTDYHNQLYSASTTQSGTQITLNSTPLPYTAILSFALTADSSKVIYKGYHTADGVSQIYSASPTAVGTEILLNNTPVTDGDVSSYASTADSSRVVYRGDLTTNNVEELYSASPTAAGTQIKLNNTPSSPNGDVSSFAIAPDSSRVVYYGDLTTDGVNELYSASTTAAGMQIKLNDTPAAGGSINFSYAIAPDSSKVVYYGDLDMDGVEDLYSASTTLEGTQVRLTNLSGTIDVLDFKIAPNSDFAVFVQRDSSNNMHSLWQVDLLGSSAPTQISPLTRSNLSSAYFSFLGDSSGIVFNASFTTASNLYFSDYTPIPEPSTWALASLGLAVSLWRIRRRK